MNRRLPRFLLGLSLLALPLAACNDNAEDHAREAQDEAAEGDRSEAREEAEEAREDLEQGDTTELRN
jgi:cellobiose-specific phosphotransferase system component IIA